MELVETYNFFGDEYNAKMKPMLYPDNQPSWALRYVWMQHRIDNEGFLKNYFTGGNNKGLNVRAATTHVQEYWDVHNKIFDQSGINGDLVWRVKAFNRETQSIDYVEIWRSYDIVKKYFLLKEGESTTVPDGTEWSYEKSKHILNGIFDTGFIFRNWTPVEPISRKHAMTAYRHFIDRAKNRDFCIINTLFKPELHS